MVFTVEAMFVEMLRPLYHLNSGPTAVRALWCQRDRLVLVEELVSQQKAKTW